jgi:hypothetical protein
MFRFFVKIWQTPNLIPTVFVSSWIVWQRSLWMSYQILSTFSVSLLVLGSPERSSSSTDTQPALKHECHSETTVWLKECSPKAS